ncbi:hypothetical protein ABFP60_11445 [Clostridioides difficile]
MIIVSRENFNEACLREYEQKAFRNNLMASVLYFCGFITCTIMYFISKYLGKGEYYVMPFIADLIIILFLTIGCVAWWKSILESKQQLGRYKRNEVKAPYYEDGIFEVVTPPGENSGIDYYFNGRKIEPIGTKLATNRVYNGHMVRIYFYSHNNKPFLMVDFG